jgi:hypothetical protein
MATAVGCGVGFGFTSNDLESHLDELRTSEGIEEIDAFSWYRIKEAGAHYVVDHMNNLEQPEKEELKALISKRTCLEQALRVERIPANYLYRALSEMPEDIKELEFVQGFIRLSETMANVARYDEVNFAAYKADDGPCIAVRQPMIKQLVTGAMGLTSDPIYTILNSDERTLEFNYGAEIVRSYIGNQVQT